MSLFENIRKRGFTDIINPIKWLIFGRYLKRRILKQKYPELFIDHLAEQAVYRITHPGCQACVKNGSCLHCGCKSPELFFDRDNFCSGGNWNEMLELEPWEEFKKMNGIVISKDHIKQLREHGRITR